MLVPPKVAYIRPAPRQRTTLTSHVIIVHVRGRVDGVNIRLGLGRPCSRRRSSRTACTLASGLSTCRAWQRNRRGSDRALPCRLLRTFATMGWLVAIAIKRARVYSHTEYEGTSAARVRSICPGTGAFLLARLGVRKVKGNRHNVARRDLRSSIASNSDS